eukprot:CAMPEP_0201879248 /NCGR_PEP_ID=MMETSP0902-20130614/10184_1 /ASSEMBLY_ACC=CAM_ASM_000551 /TAXON_ID=420261 /ORGANISM="Thalassiosira antarctica, Strain CCMP982" /LENGTH=30 /DNA_ID= /DNA_START= /DNA_END= /DNA_ORIENTATION=
MNGGGVGWGVGLGVVGFVGAMVDIVMVAWS